VGAVIGDLLPLAAGVAISPIPIIAVILMLLTPKAAAASRLFLLGWLAGITVVLIVFALLAGGLAGDGDPAAWVGVLQLLLGAALLLLAVRQWRSRPPPGQEPELPGWLRAVDTVTPLLAMGLGFLLSAVNPKNLVLLAAAGVDLGGSGLPVGSATLAGAIYVVLAASTVLVPVVAYAVAREQVGSWLSSLKTWLAANNAVVMTVLLLVMGVVLVGKGIAGL
jgi:hypothetical protein